MKRTALLFGLALATPALAGPKQSSFTPTAYQYPITRISLFKADYSGEQVLYQCTGAADACLIDVTSPASIQTIEDAAKSVALEPGVYAYLQLQSCPAGTTGMDTMTVRVQGSVTFGEDVYNTNEAATGGMALGGVAEPASIALGCGGAHAALTEPLVVTAGSEQTLTLLVDLTNVNWTDSMVSSGMGGCRSANGTGQGLCTTFPFIVPYLGAGNPTFERYLVSHLKNEGIPALSDANASVAFAVDPAGTVFYIGVSPFYSQTSPSGYDPDKGGPDYNTSTRTFSTNADGSIAFQTGGSIEDNRAGFTAFQRTSHDGTCKNEGAASSTWVYHAFKQ